MSSEITPQRIVSAMLEAFDKIEKGDERAPGQLKNQIWWLQNHYGLLPKEEINTDDPVNVAEAQAEYLALRRTKEELKAEYDKKEKRIKARQEQIAQWLGGTMDAQGVTSVTIKGVGTCFFQTDIRFAAQDWDKIYSFITQTGNFSLLNKALNATAVREIVGDNLDMSRLEGVSVSSTRSVHVRKG